MIKTLSLAAAALAMGSAALVPVAADAQRYGSRFERSYDRGDYRHEGSDRRYRMRERCNDGDGGTIIGAIAGGLLGHGIAGRGDRTLGAVVGAGAGALAGRAIDRSDRPGYCRR